MRNSPLVHVIEGEAINVEQDTTEFQPPTADQRRELRLDTLRYARLFGSGRERNHLRSIAKSLAFFETEKQSHSVTQKLRPRRPRLANVGLLTRRGTQSVQIDPSYSSAVCAAIGKQLRCELDIDRPLTPDLAKLVERLPELDGPKTSSIALFR
jgi:hypothetical protein